jgi:phage-related tail fiber protein
MARTLINTRKEIRRPFNKSAENRFKAIIDEHSVALDVNDLNPEKPAVRFATTADVTLATVALTVTDGVTPVAGDRVLVWKQSTASQNGIYVVGATAWTRATDAGTTAKVFSGMECFISEGTLYGGCRGRLLTANPITLASTSLVFAVFRGVDSTGVNGKALAVGAPANTTMAVDGVHIIAVADGSTVLDAITLDATYGKFTVTDVWFQKNTVTGGASDAVQLCTDSGGSTAVADSIGLNAKASGAIVRCAVITAANSVFAAGAHLYVKRTHTTDCGGTLYVRGYRTA